MKKLLLTSLIVFLGFGSVTFAKIQIDDLNSEILDFEYQNKGYVVELLDVTPISYVNILKDLDTANNIIDNRPNNYSESILLKNIKVDCDILRGCGSDPE